MLGTDLGDRLRDDRAMYVRRHGNKKGHLLAFREALCRTRTGDPLLTMEIPGRKWGSPTLSRVAENGLIGCDSRCWDYSVRLASTVGVHILVTCEPSQQLAGNSASQR